jgi:hypothetical protein
MKVYDVRANSSIFRETFLRSNFPMDLNSNSSLILSEVAAKFNSYTGSLWTYTTRGLVVNVCVRATPRTAGKKDFQTRPKTRS